MSNLSRVLHLAEEIAAGPIAEGAEEVDREARWPSHSMTALKEAGLTGLHVPKRLGGQALGLEGLARVTEVIGGQCASSALCFGMHCVGTAVIAAKATPYHEERYLAPIAGGEHVVTLALSERGTGTHFYLPQTRLVDGGDAYEISGRKDFITNGGQADSYVLSTVVREGPGGIGRFSCVLCDADTEGMSWDKPWSGLGMRGNSSIGLVLEGVRVPKANLLGREGDQTWYVFEVVAPYFLIAMAGTYLGVAQAAMETAVAHVAARRFRHSGEGLANAEVIQARLGRLTVKIQRCQALVHRAGRLGDLNDERALTAIIAAKLDASELAVTVANEAMTLCGGQAYRDNSTLSRCLRDARASHVMAPTTTVLELWLGRAMLGLPLL